ncbi:MAG: hypothetical protein HY287_18330 [Planctomycetes bacterium]|nr:hypothetical protein [Planctomycetota bacterium]MBI3836280.1 hypothetical protein [Planctomycetota bacterium]
MDDRANDLVIPDSNRRLIEAQDRALGDDGSTGAGMTESIGNSQPRMWLVVKRRPELRRVEGKVCASATLVRDEPQVR